MHIPAHKEPPEMLKLTLDAVARLEYPNFECVVVINNTPDPAYWQPIEEHCRTLGERFKFINVDNLDGYKAGALRLALTHTADDAEIIGVIDADYVVRPDWLKDLVPYFADQKVGMIQSPQDHRDGERSIMHNAMNGEYAGFFDIGMVQRNEANAIIVHGTMCLIRRTAIAGAGSWSSRTIVEDTDLGLTLLEQGWQVHYTNRRYGHGLLPDTYEAYKKQRHRWAYGGFQILRHHWRYLLPRARSLTRDQKREYALGWLNWLGAESLGVAVAILNLLWVPVIVLARHRDPGQDPHHPDSGGVRRVAPALRHALSAAGVDPACADGRRRSSPPCRCNGRWRAPSATASGRKASRSPAPPRAARPAAVPSSRRSGKPCWRCCCSPAPCWWS